MSHSPPLALLPLTIWLLSVVSAAEEPLHVRLDRMIAATQIGPAAAPADDAEFLRRIYLDLTGSIPSAQEAREFLDNDQADKRAKLAERLLQSDAYARHLAASFDVMLMERRPDKHVKFDAWREYLQTAFAENKPYNELAAEILGADGVDAKKRPAAKFFLDRDLEPNLMTREIGRVFFGLDLECAQCHDHPLISDYLQADYYGIYAFVSRSYVFQPDKKKPAVIAEKPTGDAKFKSVFTEEEGQTAPRPPGQTQIEAPILFQGEEYSVRPDAKNKNLRPIPKFSRRAQLAKLASGGGNSAFNRNIVNRLWAHMMGRGLVHPVDLHHSDSPPSHPQVLQLLAEEFVQHKFDVRWLLRELALSQTYQRSFRLPENARQHAPQIRQASQAARAKLAELQKAADAQADNNGKLEEAVSQAIAAAKPLEEAWSKANEAVGAAQKKVDAAVKTRDATQAQLTAKEETAKALAEAVAKNAEVVKKLKDDKELAEAAKKFQERSAKVAEEVQKLTKTRDDQTAAIKAAEAKRTEVKKAGADPLAKLTEARKRISAAQKAAAEAHSQSLARQTEITHLKKRLQVMQTLLDYDEQSTRVEQTQKTLEKTKTELAAAKQVVQQTTAELRKRTQAEQAARSAADVAKKQWSAAQIRQTQQQQAKTLLSEAAVKTEAAQKNLGEEGAELAGLIADLKAKSEQSSCLPLSWWCVSEHARLTGLCVLKRSSSSLVSL